MLVKSYLPLSTNPETMSFFIMLTLEKIKAKIKKETLNYFVYAILIATCRLLESLVTGKQTAVLTTNTTTNTTTNKQKQNKNTTTGPGNNISTMNKKFTNF